MRIRHAATALVALGAASACGLGAAVVGGSPTEHSPALATSSWSIQASTDFGTSWAQQSLAAGTTALPLRVDTAALRARAFYQPITLRTAVGSARPGTVQVGASTVLPGNQEAARFVRIRAVVASAGTCSAAAFEGGNVNLLAEESGKPATIGTRAADHAVVLDPASATTPGAPATVCLEFTREAGTGVDGVVTVAWPITATPGTDDRSR